MSSTDAKNPVPALAYPLLVDIKAVAVMLGRSVASIQRDDKAGRIPGPLTLGGSKRWRAGELRAWVRAGCPCREEWGSKWTK